MPTQRHPVSSCFGGGGAFGIGFILGVATGLRRSGIPLDDGPMIGTSAGAWSAAALATTLSAAQIFDAWDAYEPRGKPRSFDLTSQVFGDRRDARVGAVAMRLPTGRRVILSGLTHSLADVVAASSSPPRIAAPHTIDGQRFIDAGIVRATSADRAPRARVLVVVAPLGGSVLGQFGAASERLTRYEIGRWKQRSRGDVLFVRPTRQIAAFVGGKTSRLLDAESGRRAYEAAIGLGDECALRFRHRHPDAYEQLAG